jgi:hypothetical protein
MPSFSEIIKKEEAIDYRHFFIEKWLNNGYESYVRPTFQ